MLSVIQTVCSQFRRERVKTVRAKQCRVRAKINNRLNELEKLKAELQQLIAQNTTWKPDKLLIKMFHDEIEEARHCYRDKRYRMARKCSGSARATLICIARNIRFDQNSHSVIN